MNISDTGSCFNDKLKVIQIKVINSLRWEGSPLTQSLAPPISFPPVLPTPSPRKGKEKHFASLPHLSALNIPGASHLQREGSYDITAVQNVLIFYK